MFGGILLVSVIWQNIFGLVGAFARWVRSGMGTEVTSATYRRTQNPQDL